MLHRVVFIIALVLFSAAASLAVAWSTVWWEDTSAVQQTRDGIFVVPVVGDSELKWLGYRSPQGPAVTWVSAFTTKTPWQIVLPDPPNVHDAPNWSRVRQPMADDPKSNPLPTLLTEAGRGWPLHCLREDFVPTSLGRIHSLSRFGNWRPSNVALRAGSFSLFRVSIIPVGLAANTAIYATALVSLFYVPRAAHCSVRTARRRRRNQCVKCGYAREGLEDDAACPECGSTNQ